MKKRTIRTTLVLHLSGVKISIRKCDSSIGVTMWGVLWGLSVFTSLVFWDCRVPGLCCWSCGCVRFMDSEAWWRVTLQRPKTNQQEFGIPRDRLSHDEKYDYTWDSNPHTSTCKRKEKVLALDLFGAMSGCQQSKGKIKKIRKKCKVGEKKDVVSWGPKLEQSTNTQPVSIERLRRT